MNERRWAWLAVAAIALVCGHLYWPGLDSGFLADDLFQISMLEGRMGSYSPAHLYAFAPGDPASNAAHVRQGSLPWWTHPDFRFVMVRPLSSLLLAFDHLAFPRQAFAHHLHSALWFVAVLGSGYALLKRLLNPWMAVAALGCFAVDETMAWMVSWLANRCALICTVFAFSALWVHVRQAREDGSFRGRGRWLELLLWLGAFAGGEYAVGGVAYLGAYVLLGDQRPWKTRIVSLWPAVVALGAFLVAFALLGGGVYGATTYVDPFRDPGVFLQVLGHRVPRMVGEVWSNWCGDLARFWSRYESSGLSQEVMRPELTDLEDRTYRLAAFSVGTTLAWAVPAWVLARRQWTDAEARTLRWIVLGSVLAVLPIAAIPPATRALLLPNFGAAAFVGALVVALVRALRSGSSSTLLGRVLLGGVATLGVYLHVVREYVYAREHLAGLLLAGSTAERAFRTEAFAALDLEDKHVVVLSTPGLLTGVHGISMMHVYGQQAPKTWHALGIGQRAYTLRRLEDNVLELSSVGGPMHASLQELLFRNARDALSKGDAVDAGLFVATVLADRGGAGPGSVKFEFLWSLDDPRLVFLQVGPQGLLPFTVPATGTLVPLAPPGLPDPSGD